MNKGAWQATVHGVAKSQAWLSNGHSYFILKDKAKNPIYGFLDLANRKGIAKFNA